LDLQYTESESILFLPGIILIETLKVERIKLIAID